MPFEIAPHIEQQTREQLGRIALEAIAAHILTVPPEAFDLDSWKCGTVACAIGHGCSLPEVQATGLHLVQVRRMSGIVFETVSRSGARNWPAVQEALGLADETAEHLFYAYHYERDQRDAPHVAARIREYLARTA